MMLIFFRYVDALVKANGHYLVAGKEGYVMLLILADVSVVVETTKFEIWS